MQDLALAILFITGGLVILAALMSMIKSADLLRTLVSENRSRHVELMQRLEAIDTSISTAMYSAGQSSLDLLDQLKDIEQNTRPLEDPNQY